MWKGVPPLGSRSVDVGRSFSRGWVAVDISLTLQQGIWILVFLARAVNRDLNSDLAALDLLAIHLGARFLLHLFTREGDETEAAAFAWLVTGLELADHELGDRTESDFGGGWRVIGEDFEELLYVSDCGDVEES